MSGLQLLAKADAGVEPVGDDVAIAILDQHLDACVGMRCGEAGQYRADHPVVGLSGRSDADCPGDGIPLAIQCVERAFDPLQGGTERLEERHPCLAGRHAAAIALEQPGAEPLL